MDELEGQEGSVLKEEERKEEDESEISFNPSKIKNFPSSLNLI